MPVAADNQISTPRNGGLQKLIIAGVNLDHTQMLGGCNELCFVEHVAYNVIHYLNWQGELRATQDDQILMDDFISDEEHKVPCAPMFDHSRQYAPQHRQGFPKLLSLRP